MSRPIFLPIGKDCFKLSIAVFRFGCSAAHIMLLLCINTLILVYHVSEYLFLRTARHMIDNRRVKILKESGGRRGPVVLWMNRDQRMNDNWALLFAQELAIKQKTSLAVVFCLVPQFLNATIRQYGFMMRGLQEVEKNLKKKNIPFFLLTGLPEIEMPKFFKWIST